MLWHCWLGGRKGIRPVKNWVVECWRGYLSGARCRLAYDPADATHCHSLSLDSVKSRLFFPFWYRLTYVVRDKGPLNGCACCAKLLYRTQHGAVLIIFPLDLQTIITAQMPSIGGEGGTNSHKHNRHAVPSILAVIHPWPSHLRVKACRGHAMDCISTNFGVVDKQK